MLHLQISTLGYCEQGKNYAERAMLIYDGLHYDALAVIPSFFPFLFISRNNVWSYMGWY